MKFFYCLKEYSNTLCMENNIVQMATSASLGGAHTRSPVFNDSGAQIGLYFIDGVAYVDFEVISVSWLVCVDLRFKKTPQEIV